MASRPERELVDVDGAGALNLNGVYFLILDNHVLAFGDLIAADHIFPGRQLRRLGIDVLLLQPVARFPVDPIMAARGARAAATSRVRMPHDSRLLAVQPNAPQPFAGRPRTRFGLESRRRSLAQPKSLGTR
jgi:hypothetical protein